MLGELASLKDFKTSVGVSRFKRLNILFVGCVGVGAQNQWDSTEFRKSTTRQVRSG